MTITTGPAVLTHAEYLDTLRNRFGPNPADWPFICPACSDIATGHDFLDALDQHPRDRRGEPVTAAELLGQECIGRTLGALTATAGSWNGRGCDWASYGLIPGPLAVELDDGRTARSFHIAPARDDR